jgi:hypothetical protein
LKPLTLEFLVREEKQMNKRRALPLILLVLIAASAFAQDVRYNFDQQADFSKYKTYTWSKLPGSMDVDELTLKQLGAAFDAELAKKGLTRVDSGTGDLIIVYQIALKQETQINAYNSGYSAGGYWGRGWYGGGRGFTTASTTTIPIGVGVLSFYDSAKKELVWRGEVSKAIDTGAKPDKQQKNMAKVAEKLLKDYPPKKKK